MKKIAVIPNFINDKDGSCFRQICEYMSGLVACINVPLGSREVDIANIAYLPFEECFADVAFAVIIGGDGSILNSAPYACAHNVPMVGVNLGHVGYLAEIERSDISELEDILKGNYSIQERMMLSVTACGNEYTVLNDAVISKGALNRMVRIKLSCNGMVASDFMSDGMIVSTPTGSTAYSLSAGGPVIDPLLECIAATPICPHTLTARPLVFKGDCVLSLSASNAQEIYLSLDGKNYITIPAGDEVVIRKSEKKLKLIITGDGNFCKTLSYKLSEKKQ